MQCFDSRRGWRCHHKGHLTLRSCRQDSDSRSFADTMTAGLAAWHRDWQVARRVPPRNLNAAGQKKHEVSLNPSPAARRCPAAWPGCVGASATPQLPPSTCPKVAIRPGGLLVLRSRIWANLARIAELCYAAGETAFMRTSNQALARLTLNG